MNWLNKIKKKNYARTYYNIIVKRSWILNYASENDLGYMNEEYPENSKRTFDFTTRKLIIIQ